MQSWCAAAHCFASFGPNLSLDTTAADGAGGFAVFQEEHLRAAPLRRRAARVRAPRHDDSLAAPIRFVAQPVEFVLSDSCHFCGTDFSLCAKQELTQTEVCATYGLGVGVGPGYGCMGCTGCSDCPFVFAFSIAARSAASSLFCNLSISASAVAIACCSRCSFAAN